MPIFDEMFENLLRIEDYTRKHTDKDRYAIAKKAHMPGQICEFLAMAPKWTIYPLAFRYLCKLISDDTSLPELVRAYVLVHLGNTLRRRNEWSVRDSCYSRAMQLASGTDINREQFEHIHRLCEAGRAATSAATATAETPRPTA